MSSNLRIALAQLNFIVGDISGNTAKVIAAAKQAKNQLNANLIIFPELTLTSYPPEDLLLRKILFSQVEQAIHQICQAINDIDMIIGHPTQTKAGIFNSCTWIRNGRKLATYYKQKLPNYGVFDEYRYFLQGHDPVIIEITGIKVGLLICEDLWHPAPISQAKQAGAQLIVSLNASPYSFTKAHQRLAILKQRIVETELPIVYVNHVGGQDDLVFDGGSLVLNQQAGICCQLHNYIEQIEVIELSENLVIQKQPLPAPLTKIESIYQALVLGVKDYLHKNGFSSTIIGLSGGIDSALTLAIAVDALGAKSVEAVMMPSRYTSALSLEQAKIQADLLQVKYQIIAIESVINAFSETLSPFIQFQPGEITAQNIQARARGTLLMALSNQTGKIVLSTSNKSEMAVGYSTLYGDMAGGFCVLKDVYKTLVYELANYRNTVNYVIPSAVIERAPSAELAENQTDQDTLPPYGELDQILEMYIEQDYSITQIIEQGFAKETVQRIVNMIKRNEYKRYQAPSGPRITEKALKRDWRYPLTNRFEEQ